MRINLSAGGSRVRVISNRLFRRVGLGEETFLWVLAVLIGAVTGVTAVGFHELINVVRDFLYKRPGPDALYGSKMWLLVLFPTLGGLAVGLLSRYVFRTKEGHGIVDVVESVVRTSGFQKPITAVEKVLTSACTLGSGGSSGTEGPIVQIGAAIASGVGQLFAVSRAQMPALTGCGCAAGISAIFNAPFGGVLFTLEVILQDFSLRLFTPVVLASVIAQVATQGTFAVFKHADEYRAIFPIPADMHRPPLGLGQVWTFVVLGAICGIIGAIFTRTMIWTERFFHSTGIPRPVRPAVGGAILGISGVLFVLIFGGLLHAKYKPFPYEIYPMPAYFGDSYGIIKYMLSPQFYSRIGAGMVVLLLVLLVLKMLGTGVTLGSGGSGGVIAPSLFLGATSGAVLGHLLQQTGWFLDLQPEVYALVGMGACLAAVVHAPLASILIVFELTQDHAVMLPAMLACIVAVAAGRLVYPDSVYTLALRQRGVQVGTGSDLVLLRRLTIEQISLEPVTIVGESAPIQQLLDISALTSAYDFVVVDAAGKYRGMVLSADLNPVLRDQDAVPILVVADVMRYEIDPVQISDDLAAVMESFSKFDVSHLPVSTTGQPEKIIGLVSRAALIRKYQEALKKG